MIADPYPVLWTGQWAVVVLPDHMDLSNTAEIRSQLLSVINRGATALIADMSATISCDHSGPAAVARAYQRAVTNGTDLRLVISSQVVRRVIRIAGIDQLMSVYPTLEAALADRAPAAPGRTPVKNGVATARAGSAPDTGPGTEVALLDREGVIVSVNGAWRDFAAANGGEPARVGRGVSYLEVCAAAGDDPVARNVGAAIRRALAGDLPGPLVVEVPCHSPHAERWFDMLISGRMDDDERPTGATVTLSLARSRSRVTPEVPAVDEDSVKLLLRLAEDHDRIAAGLNDLLVHRLFSAGLSLQAALSILGDHPVAEKIWAAVDDLDRAIIDLRSILFDQPVAATRSLTG